MLKSLTDCGFSCESSKPIKILSGGETISVELSNLLLSRHFLLWNFFGATEATISTILYPVKHIEGLSQIMNFP